MNEECKTCDDYLPTELDGVKFQYGWYYLVNKNSLEPYISKKEKDTDYRSIEIILDYNEFNFSEEISYSAVFFTNIKKTGISGELCEVSGSQENKAEIKERFLKRLHEIIPSLKLKPDLKMLAQKKKKLENELEVTIQEIKEIDALLNKNNI